MTAPASTLPGLTAGVWTIDPGHSEVSFTVRHLMSKVRGVFTEFSGEVTIAGVTRPVELAVEFLGIGVDPWGGARAGFSARAQINRKDFGIEWNAALEGGGFLVGDTVKIVIEVEAAKQA